MRLFTAFPKLSFTGLQGLSLSLTQGLNRSLTSSLIRLSSPLVFIGSSLYSFVSLAQASPTAASQTGTPAIASIPNTNPALASLKDIIQPEAVSTFPQAPGYYLSALLLLGLISATAAIYYRRRKRLAPLRAVQAQLLTLPADSQTSVQVNALIKRTLLSYIPRQEIASLSGKQWQNWLDAQLSSAQATKFDREHFHRLLGNRYQDSSLSATDASQLKMLADQWLQMAVPRLSKIGKGIPPEHKPLSHTADKGSIKAQEELG